MSSTLHLPPCSHRVINIVTLGLEPNEGSCRVDCASDSIATTPVMKESVVRLFSWCSNVVSSFACSCTRWTDNACGIVPLWYERQQAQHDILQRLYNWGVWKFRVVKRGKVIDGAVRAVDLEAALGWSNYSESMGAACLGILLRMRDFPLSVPH
eukprot:1987027-Amphidinium_carterae.2